MGRFEDAGSRGRDHNSDRSEYASVMIAIAPLLARIDALLAENTDQSVTFAALEARLALEKVCYDRLRQRHDYISHADLRGWTPNYVMNTIVAEVDENFGQSLRLYVADGSTPTAENDGFIEVGTEIGLDQARIVKLWNALSNLALHVKLPESRNDQIPQYGNVNQIREKVREAIAELSRLSQGTMTFSGIGDEVSFQCECGQKNRRRAGLLKAHQSVSCLSPTCRRSYRVLAEANDEITFELEVVEIPCAACNFVIHASQSQLMKLGRSEPANVKCSKCGHDNRVMWVLGRADLATTSEQSGKEN